MAEIETERQEARSLRAEKLVTAAEHRADLQALAEREKRAEARWTAISHRVAPAALVQAAATDLMDLVDQAEVDARADALLKRWIDLELSVRRRIIAALVTITILKGERGGHYPRRRIEVRSRKTDELIS